MKRILLSTTLLFVLSAPVFAADDDYTIKIIQEDGSVEVIDLRRPDEPPPAPAVQAAPPVEEAPRPAGQAVSMSGAAPKPAPSKPAAVKAAAKAAPPPPPAPKMVTPPRMPVQREIQAGKAPIITRGKAISIALGYAPASSDVEVFRASYEGQNVYAVVFKTEDGFHEVLIDDQSGKVLESRESVAFEQRAAQPGHLPVDLR